jgi:hypothetical protein
MGRDFEIREMMIDVMEPKFDAHDRATPAPSTSPQKTVTVRRSPEAWFHYTSSSHGIRLFS